MRRNFLFMALLVSLFTAGLASAGTYAPAAGQSGSTAISMNDATFVSWATGIDIVRGYKDISNPSGGLASYGTPANALSKAAGTSSDVVSLGDAGIATLTFAAPIINGAGWDFAVFENGFSDTYLELGFVEVSSDGLNFFRFNSVSQTQTETQVGSFGSVDATDLNNLAGKYRQGYGTPFDLAELAGISGLDINHVSYVRIIDVIGSINPLYATYDSLGNIVNDPFPTAFTSGGFDLDAVGVIHQAPIPGTVWLLASGVCGLLALKRKKASA